MSKTSGPVGGQSDDTTGDGDIQLLGHQLASLSGFVVVALVEFGVPLTPAQQSSILSIIVTGWAVASTIYGIRHRVARKTKRTQRTPKHKHDNGK